ncbi:hypothetical protein BMETH_1165_0 [methanotrophic bacterial endosymbiont of Bathymodiolus sp.]|nr:hypothetical protein BMETH_1165_0 [methanotrophic bacterial endosymbiont of Bathymodiolus sp.]
MNLILNRGNFFMARPDFVIVKIMGRRNFNATGTKFWVYIFIGNNRN